jgi:hypothetical protein
MMHLCDIDVNAGEIVSRATDSLRTGCFAFYRGMLKIATIGRPWVNVTGNVKELPTPVPVSDENRVH